MIESSSRARVVRSSCFGLPSAQIVAQKNADFNGLRMDSRVVRRAPAPGPRRSPRGFRRPGSGRARRRWRPTASACAGRLGQLVGDDADLAGPAGALERRDEAGIAGAEIVDARRDPGASRAVRAPPPRSAASSSKPSSGPMISMPGNSARQHRRKPSSRSRWSRRPSEPAISADLAALAAEAARAARRRCGPPRLIVDADEALAGRARQVRDQRHHRDAAPRRGVDGACAPRRPRWRRRRRSRRSAGVERRRAARPAPRHRAA